MSSAARSPSSPCSGRTSAASNSGSPTGPFSTATAARQASTRLLRERRPRRADRGAAEQPLVDLDVGREQLEHEPRFARDLGPDSVAGKEDDALR